ncbi:hypothetical protein [Marinilactibacillus psychrotolerans]|uniref:Uncharacterized protein n=1 Tax=Marinilactibacillus psychrotolerans TaxID=191770 RepID=A0A5R9BVJ3_9LACT|nr:hypothetical protein [Marinilactibacillus psychrotolerans]TLQ04726.1 hypothetical protein FEZ48_13350 [Marinilactibacillus psychrotolerans]
MPRKKKQRSKNLDVLKTMPPLKHKQANQDYDIEKSDLVDWLLSQPEIKQWVVSYLKGLSDYLIYDSKTECWVGVDYKGGQDNE